MELSHEYLEALAVRLNSNAARIASYLVETRLDDRERGRREQERQDLVAAATILSQADPFVWRDDAERRKGDWGCTYTGRQYWPEDPRPEDICIEDIAHALAFQCRFGGHTSAFYSVAQHSVLVSTICPPFDQLWGLLHDASEAYIVDIPRPLKRARGMEGYGPIEALHMAAICTRFGLPHQMPPTVKRADEKLLATEARDLMPTASVADWDLPEPALSERITSPWAPKLAEEIFLMRFADLEAQR